MARLFVPERILLVVPSRFLVSHRSGFVRPLDRPPVYRRHLAGERVGTKQAAARVKTNKQNMAVVCWLVGVCRKKQIVMGPNLPKGGPGSACSVPGRPMEEMVWARKKSRRRAWKEKVDI